MTEQTITILGDEMPMEMYREFVKILSPTLKGYKYGCAPEDFSCPICMGGNESAVVITECNHIYHVDCIESWLEIINNCPMCRNVMPGCNKKLVEEMLNKLKIYIKTCILKNWWDQLGNFSKEELGELKSKLESGEIIPKFF